MTGRDGEGEGILQAAKRYVDLGLSVIPIDRNSKRPLVEWKQYQERRPTSDELTGWFGGPTPPNIAVVCGEVSGKLVVLDFDDEDLFGVYFTHDDISSRTVVVRSARRGYHVWLRTDQSFQKFKPVPGLDVQADGAYVLAPPSVTPEGAYKFVSVEGTPIMSVANLQHDIFSRLREAGIDVGRTKKPISKIMKGGLSEGEGRNSDGFRYALYLARNAGLSTDAVWAELQRWNGLHKDLMSEGELRTIFDSAMKYVIEDSETAEKQTVHTPFVETDDVLAEQGFDGRSVYYVVFNTANNNITKASELAVGEVTFKPIEGNHPKNQQVLLPSWPEEYDTEEALAKEIESFLDYYHEEPDRLQRQLDILYIFLTYVSFGKNCKGMVPQIPYRRRKGWFGGGKTRAAEVVGAVCYRPFYIAGCGSEAALRRRFDMWRGTAIMDESDFGNSDLHSTIVKVLNSGWDAHLGYYDLQDAENPNISYSLYVYGPKVLATREEFKDLALESRCLTAHAADKTKRMPIALTETFYEKALHLRNKLLLWRFKNYLRFKEMVKRLEDPDLEAEIFGDLDISGRIKQVIAPIWLIADDTLRAKIREIAQALDQDIKARDKTYQVSLQVSDATRELLALDKMGEVSELAEVTQYIVRAGGKVTNNTIVIPLKRIVEMVVGEGQDIDGTVNKKVAKACREILLFTVRAGTGNRRMVYIPLGYLKTLYPNVEALQKLDTL